MLNRLIKYIKFFWKSETNWKHYKPTLDIKCFMEEFIGKKIDRAVQLLYRARQSKWQHEAAPFKTRPHLGRFTALASMLAGREVRVVDIKGDVFPRPYRPILQKMAHPALMPDFAFGWSDGETIFLPMSFIDMLRSDDQEALAKLLIFFLSAQIKYASLTLALLESKQFENDRLVADLYWITENSRLKTLLLKEFPGIRPSWEKTLSRLLYRRPKPAHLYKAEQQVEQFLCSSLTATPDTNSPQESLAKALALKNKWRSQGVTLNRYRALVPFSPWGRFLPNKIKKVGLNDNIASAEEVEKEKNGSKDKEGETARYNTRREDIDEKKNESGLALNIYDKMISWARFVNVTRPFDDDPDADSGKKADEMEELSTAIVRKKTSSFLNAEMEKDALTDEETPHEQGKKEFLYPEWDYRTSKYKLGFSILEETRSTEELGDFVNTVLTEKKGLIREVRRSFESLMPAVKIMYRQFEGNEIDIDAAVEAVADLKSGRQPDERIFSTYKRTERDISVLFLIDMSMSTDAWVKKRRIIDHEKEALIVLCEAIKSLGDRYAIYGFSGQTRKKCKVFNVKGFDDTYGEGVKRRIEGLIPYHYTRMGPAIRHAAEILKKESSAVKLLFIISDGKPNDLDEYEGRYGIEDTRMAVREVERGGAIPFCLTVDSKARQYLTKLFGRGNYVLVPGVDRLAKSLPELYARILRQL